MSKLPAAADDRTRQRRNVWLGLAHALLAVLILAGFVYVQSGK